MSTDHAWTIIALASLAVLLLLPPLVWHSGTRNTPGIILIVWLLIMDIKCIVDAAIWGGTDFASRWAGYGWCDLMIRLQAGANVGISCAVSNIAFNLRRILKADAALPNAGSYKKVVVDLSFCIVSPLVVMGLTFLAQAFRFAIFRYSGCQVALSPTWVTAVCYTLWILIWSMVGFVYAILLLLVFYRRRKDVRDILHCTNSGLNLARFARLLIFCLVIILVMFPFSVFSFVEDLRNVEGGYIFIFKANREMWNQIPHLDPGSPLYSIWLYILMSYLVFLIFGLGSDALSMYAGIARAIGFGAVMDRWNSHVNRNSDKHTDRITRQFLHRHGYDEFHSKPCADSAAARTDKSMPSTPTNFVVDYALPQDLKREERRRRQAYNNGNIYFDDSALGMGRYGDCQLDLESGIDLSPMTAISFSRELNGSMKDTAASVSICSDDTKAEVFPPQHSHRGRN
ncbi:AEL131Cp [Eremothecium gossypii ATCC 10895]|uniref:AEL131Cp n=1 Tax=Eremothecium gossypii (strain ATCC 10895 / CBS 109.51 / FGSC 9923 / NRRL Y-1056) TaxID=284811 RepID=Q757Z1_EREGS|nr:AEL131Cp [Eremothecium gossypii ATCC 10895]AAS52554.1 AEL131Cp [Eremothecium gossypii ATCC 10895]AEY96855.1 FAEL131Cp [Eremothecium gossypii FDAG1]